MLNIKELNVKCPEVEYVLNAASKYALGDDNAFISFYNAQDGQPVDTSPIIEDFGDVAPFLWVCGDPDIARKEFKAVFDALGQDVLHINPRRSRQWMIHTYDWTDLLLGLMDYYEISRDENALALLSQIFDVWQDAFCHDHTVSGQAIKLQGRLYALPVSRMLDVGMFPELLLKYAAFVDEDQAADLKERAAFIVRQWAATDFSQKTGLFPDTAISQNPMRGAIETLVSAVTGKLDTHHSCTLFKHNTNALASVLSVWVQTKDPEFLELMAKWLRGCRTHLLNADNRVNMSWHATKGVTKGATDHNFQVVDLMCDIAYETKDDQYIDFAVSVADAWIKMLSPIGLMPHHESGKRSHQAMSDSQTDFSVALLKLAALTGNKEYAIVAEKIMAAVKKYMYLPCGMATWVNVHDGTPLDNVCKTKFMILSLKGWLALHNQEKIYQDEEFTKILSDR